MTKEKREIRQGGDRIWMIADINFMNKDKIGNKKYFPIICPDCGNKAGHLYEHRYEAGKDAGGMWVWCSACHNYEHYRARLPKWWKNPDFIEFGKLCHQPDYLEEHKEDIDKWVNSLLLTDWSDENVQDIKQEIISLLREKLLDNTTYKL